MPEGLAATMSPAGTPRPRAVPAGPGQAGQRGGRAGRPAPARGRVVSLRSPAAPSRALAELAAAGEPRADLRLLRQGGRVLPHAVARPALAAPVPRPRRRHARPLGQPERRHLGRRPLEPDRPGHRPLRRLPRRGRDRAQGGLRPAGRARRARRLLQPRDALLRGPLARRLRPVLGHAPRLPRRPDHRRHAAAPPRGQAARQAVRLSRLLPARQPGRSSPTGSATRIPGRALGRGRQVHADRRPGQRPAARRADARRPAAVARRSSTTRGTLGHRPALRDRHDRAARSRTRGTPCCSSATTTSCPTARPCSARCRATSGTSTGSTTRSNSVRWRRFASGLHQALGLVVADGQVHVLGRDQITRLHDLERRRRGRLLRVLEQRLRDLAGRPRLHLRPPARRRGQLLHGLGQAGAAADLARRQVGRGRGHRLSQPRRPGPHARRRAHRAQLGRRVGPGVDGLRGPAGRALRLSRARGTASLPTCRSSTCRAGWTTRAAARSR